MSQRLQGIRILCVDDYADTLEILRYILEMHGCEVRTASTGAAAVELMNVFKPQLMVTDLQLPDEDGVDLLLRMQRLVAHWTEMPAAIAVSAHGAEHERALARTSGFLGFIQKPFDESTLIATLESALEESKPAAA